MYHQRSSKFLKLAPLLMKLTKNLRPKTLIRLITTHWFKTTCKAKVMNLRLICPQNLPILWKHLLRSFRLNCPRKRKWKRCLTKTLSCWMLRIGLTISWGPSWCQDSPTKRFGWPLSKSRSTTRQPSSSIGTTHFSARASFLRAVFTTTSSSTAPSSSTSSSLKWPLRRCSKCQCSRARPTSSPTRLKAGSNFHAKSLCLKSCPSWAKWLLFRQGPDMRASSLLMCPSGKSTLSSKLNRT